MIDDQTSDHLKHIEKKHPFVQQRGLFKVFDRPRLNNCEMCACVLYLRSSAVLFHMPDDGDDDATMMMMIMFNSWLLA